MDLNKIPQVLACFSANLGAFSLGIVLSWTSPALPFLSNCNDKSSSSIVTYNSNFKNCTLQQAFTDEQASWIGSLFGIGALLSCIATGHMMSKIGRKWTMIGLNAPLLLGWICLLIPAYKTDITGWLQKKTKRSTFLGNRLVGMPK